MVIALMPSPLTTKLICLFSETSTNFIGFLGIRVSEILVFFTTFNLLHELHPKSSQRPTSYSLSEEELEELLEESSPLFCLRFFALARLRFFLSFLTFFSDLANFATTLL